MLNILISATMMSVVIAGCSMQNGNNKVTNKSLDLKQTLGQKIMLDLRYYCGDKGLDKPCRTPMRSLPPELAEMIAQYNLGGVILFSDNLDNIEQIVRLNHQLHLAGSQSASELPLFISIDQEGGRVARLPRANSSAFSGNMAIGATAKQYGDKFATLTGDVIGKEVAAAGFNVNHAPTVDVNVNPNNPVINVRSFSEDPKLVAKLGYAQLAAMQKHNIIATLKHFPGHGDTSVDSHTGLPKVEHSLKQIESVDLAPFQYAIDKKAVSMIMTAHIQYPELDRSTFVSKEGKTMMKPATMSRAILTDLLRHKMGFDGLVITDALDMKGISEFFTESEAVIETFKAGSDIALMPLKIRNRSEISKVADLINQLERAVLKGELDLAEIDASYRRIANIKQSQLNYDLNEPVSKKIARANKVIGQVEHKKAEQALADASITVFKGQGQLPSSVKTVQIFMPDDSKCEATLNAFSELNSKLEVRCSPYYNLTLAQVKAKILAADAVVATNVTPQQSLVEMGGMDDIAHLSKKLGNLHKNKRAQDKMLDALLTFAKGKSKHVSFVSLRMPYEAQRYARNADSLLVTYAYNQHVDAESKQTIGATYRALAKVLTGKLSATGSLPVSVNLP